MDRWRKMLAKPLIVLGATLLALGVLELVVRLGRLVPAVIPIGVTSESQVYQRSKNPILSFEFKPNYRNESPDLKFDYGRTNSHGQRDVERTYDKPPGTKRILLLGDSVVVGYGVRDIDQLMSRQLEKLYPDNNVEALNLAVTGYCTRAEVELLRTKGVRYDPDLVILLFVENDFRNFNPEALSTEGITDRPPVVNSLFQSSHLFRLACLKLDWFHFGLETDPAYWNQRAIGDNNVPDALALLRQLADQYGFQTMIAAWPMFTNDAITYGEKMLMPDDSDQLLVERLAGAYGLQVFRLSEQFQKHWQSLVPRPNPQAHYTIGDQMHPSVTGHQVTAHILKELIAAHQLLDRSPVSATTAATLDAAAIEAAKALGREKADYSLVHYNRGVELLRDGKAEDAIDEFQQTIRAGSVYADDAHIHIAQILAQKGQTDQAVRHYREALGANPQHYLAHVNLGNILQAQGKTDEAIGEFRSAIEVRPDQYTAYYNLGVALMSQGTTEEAAEHLQTAARLDPDQPQVARQLAQVYRNLGQVDGAIAEYQRAMRLAPGVAQDHTELGLALATAGRLDEAIAQFRQGLAIDPDHGELHFHLGRALGFQGKLDEGLAHLRRARELEPAQAKICSALGVVLARRGHVAEAIECFSRAVELDPDDEQARKNLAVLRARRK